MLINDTSTVSLVFYFISIRSTTIRLLHYVPTAPIYWRRPTLPLAQVFPNKGQRTEVQYHLLVLSSSVNQGLRALSSVPVGVRESSICKLQPLCGQVPVNTFSRHATCNREITLYDKVKLGGFSEFASSISFHLVGVQMPLHV